MHFENVQFAVTIFLLFFYYFLIFSRILNLDLFAQTLFVHTLYARHVLHILEENIFHCSIPRVTSFVSLRHMQLFSGNPIGISREQFL